MKQIVCNKGTCIVDAEVTFYNHTVKVVHNADSKGMEVFLDGRILYSSTSVTLDNGCVLKLKKEVKTTYTLTVSDVGLHVNFTAQSGALLVATELTDASCCGKVLKGLCGSCRACSGKPPTTPRCPLMEAEFSYSDNSGVVNIDNSTTKEEFDKIVEGTIIRELRGAGRCICFTNSTAATNEIKLFSKRFTTIEFMVRTCAEPRCYGIVLSFSGTKTFALVHDDDMVRIVLGNKTVLNSNLALPNNTWTFISIELNRETQDGKLYMFAKGSFLGWKTFKYLDKVTTNTSIGMGHWQLSKNGTRHRKTKQFVGCIDQLRIWHKLV